MWLFAITGLAHGTVVRAALRALTFWWGRKTTEKARE